jgi:hypothetical protein
MLILITIDIVVIDVIIKMSGIKIKMMNDENDDDE